MLATRNWIDYVQEIVKKLNNRQHRTIHMSPVQAYLPENQQKLKMIYKQNNTRPRGVPKFKIKDAVRVSRQKGIFGKGTLKNTL